MSTKTPPRSRGIVFGVWSLMGSFGWFFSPITGSAIAVYLSTKHVFLFYSIFQFLVMFMVIGLQVYGLSKRRGYSA
jgi:MFS family permease